MKHFNPILLKKLGEIWEEQNRADVLLIDTPLLKEYYKELKRTKSLTWRLPYYPLVFNGSYLVPDDFSITGIFDYKLADAQSGG